ncbi:hypothetical protein G7Y89_g5895 [Cudoniella acicularis]|uniref:Uncharacterized protein n=1 Tax=Cudoniella acicularis TaxID=354080 RepID=A0A8H4W3D3_9HELO|nr:hypothetical protein G7Y89_g5895 [Cudoniella acicularis]
MKSFTISGLLAALLFAVLLVEASPLNAIAPHRGIHFRKAKGIGAVGTGIKPTRAAGVAKATGAARGKATVSAVAAVEASSSVAASAKGKGKATASSAVAKQAISAAAGVSVASVAKAKGKTTAATASKNEKTTAVSSAATTSATSALNATILDCQITVPANPLTAEGLATPYILQAPCSQAVGTQQAFAEAAIFDPTTNTVSIYHPLVINAGKDLCEFENCKRKQADSSLGTTPFAAPVVPTIPAGATVGLWFGFNGGVLKLVDANGLDTNNSPLLKAITCINGLAGVQGDVFGQVSWCNAQQFFAAANAGKIVIPPLGTDINGATCPTSRSFEITDACPSDNVPTQYLLLADGRTAQDTAANRAANPDATVINNASDEALLANIIDPLIKCTPFTGASLDDPGVNVPALALSELQAGALQQAPIGLVPLNDPDTLLTNGGTVSTAKTNEYRLGVNQPLVAAGNDSGALIPYCDGMLSVGPKFFADNEATFIGQTTPDACVGNNLFTFMCMRFIMSLTQLTCPVSQEVDPVVCQTDSTGAATSCTINLSATATATNSKAATGTATVANTKATATGTATKAKGVATKGTRKATAASGATKATGKGTKATASA